MADKTKQNAPSRRKLLIIAGSLCGLVLLAVVGFVCFSGGVSSGHSATGSSRSATLDCRHAKNKNTPYCVERAARTEATWRRIQRAPRSGASAPMFGLND